MSPPHGRFAAIDFETADYGPDSACSVALVVVDGLTIVNTGHFLIRPPRDRFHFTYIHGITWDHVKDQPTFGELWPAAAKLLDGVEFLAAHNAPFDRNVLRACCAAAGLPVPAIPFQCTVQVAQDLESVSDEAAGRVSVLEPAIEAPRCGIGRDGLREHRDRGAAGRGGGDDRVTPVEMTRSRLERPRRANPKRPDSSLRAVPSRTSLVREITACPEWNRRRRTVRRTP